MSAPRLTLDERYVRSYERIAAAQEAALEQTQVSEWDSKVQGNPKANHPNFAIRRHLLRACGGFPEGDLSDGRQGEGYPGHLWATLQDSLMFYERYPRLNFTVGVRHFIATVRGRLGYLPVGSFLDTPLHVRLSQPSPFDQTRPEPLPPDPTTTAEVHRCGANMAEFFSVTIGSVIGDAFRAFNEECHRLSCHQQGVTASVYVSYLRAGLHRIDRNVDRTIAGVKDVAALTGRRLGTGSTGLGSWTDFCMAPGPYGGSVLISPVDGLGVGDPRGVLQTIARARRLQSEAISAD